VPLPLHEPSRSMRLRQRLALVHKGRMQRAEWDSRLEALCRGRSLRTPVTSTPLLSR